MANPKKQNEENINTGAQGDTGSRGTDQNAVSSATGSGAGNNSPSSGSPGVSGAQGVSGISTGAGTGTATARSFYDQAKETAGHAYEAAAEKATTKLEEKKTVVSGGLASVADSVRRVSENLKGPDVQDGISKFAGQYSDIAAQKIEGVANYFENKNIREMYGDLESFARKNPAVFVGGAFALGLLAARFLKSNTSNRAGSGIGGRSDNEFRGINSPSGSEV